MAMMGAILSGCVATSSGLSPTPTAVQVATDLPPPTQAAPATAPDFRLQPYDMVTIQVVGVEDLRRQTRIDGAGNINYPYVGTIQAAGMSTEALSQRIADGLRGRYIRNPQVSVAVDDIVGRVLTVDGAVRLPGRYPVYGGMTLQSAIASAQGTSDTARITEVVVFRTVNGRQMAALFSLKDIHEGRYPDPQLYANDIVIVGTSRARYLWTQFAAVAPIFSAFIPLAYIFRN
jgi:polysaccharide export outer membrane protein